VSTVRHTGSLRPIAICEQKVHAPTKTDLAPSPLFDLISQHTTEPAILNPYDPRLNGVHPLTLGMNKYSQSFAQLDSTLVDIAAQSILEDLNAQVSKSPKRVLTIDESINGIPGVPYVDPLAMKPSAGYPFALSNTLKGPKRKLFKKRNDNTYEPENPILIEQLKTVQQELYSGIANTDQFIDTIKDERRPIAKITKGRMFSVAPLSLTILSRTLFLSFFAHMYASRLRTFSAIGINKGSLEWHYMIKRMLEVGSHGTAGDYSKWDGTLLATCFFACLTIINSWYNERCQKTKTARKTVFIRVCFCHHRNEYFIYETIGGMPSGWDGTVNINTLVNEMYLRVCWMLLVPLHYRDLTHYRRFVRTAIYGDDNALTVDNHFISIFNGAAIARTLLPFGIVLTPATKQGGFEADSIDLMECTFLKNSTGIFEGKYVPLMEIDALLESINWIRPSSEFTNDQLCNENCNMVLMSLFFYGPVIFNSIRDKILSYKPKYTLLSFYHLRAEFLQEGIVTDPMNSYGFTKNNNHSPFAHQSQLEDFAKIES